MYTRLITPPKDKSFFLFRPRGTGKTTWVRALSHNMEVDFVLYGDKGILAFEVKRTGKVTTKMLAGLKAFLKDYPMAKVCFVSGGGCRMREGKIDILPGNLFLSEIPEILANKNP